MDKLTMAKVLKRIDDLIAARQPRQIVVVNVAKLLLAKRDPELHRIIEEAAIVGADGVPVLWASRLLNDPVPERINGTDLLELLLERAATRGYRVYFLGATQTILDRAVRNYTSRYPTLQVAGAHHGYFTRDDEAALVARIREACPDVLFVAISSPLKEKFVHRNLEALAVPVCHGVGGSLDIAAGATKRAPRWMQRSGLEWLYRLCQEPRRLFVRYACSNTEFVVLLARDVFLQYMRKRAR